MDKKECCHKEKEKPKIHIHHDHSTGNIWYARILIMVIIGGGIWSILWGWMQTFMGVFFVLVALLKLLDWRGFIDAFSMYDIVAKRARIYAIAYPLIELALGLGYLLNTQVQTVAIVTVIIMLVGSIGVTQNLLSKNPIKCACLGTLIKVPLTKITLLEDVLMAVMAIIILI